MSEAATLTVEATYTENVLTMRMQGAIADLPNGRKVEVSSSIDQASVLITISNADKTWRTYFLSAHALATAALQHEAGAKMESDGTRAAATEETT